MSKFGFCWFLIILAAIAGRAATEPDRIGDGTFSVLSFGARGDGITNDAPAIQRAVDACAQAGGGRVFLLPGKTYLAGAITLRSNVDFHIPRGAILKAAVNWREYGQEGALLFAQAAAGVTVSGDGTIEGNDRAIWQQLADEEAGGDVNKADWWPQAFCGEWWPFFKKPGEKPKTGGRPRLILLINCQQVRIRNLTLRHAPSWTIHLAGCEDVVIDSISILNAWDVANNDGIDLDHCRKVRIANCLLDCADDCIAIKNTPNFAHLGGTERITVTGCTVASRSAALKVDEIYAAPGARDIVFADCVVSRSNRGLCIQSRDEGDIANVLFSNIIVETEFQPHKWWGAAEPIHLSHFPRTPETKLGRVRNVRFSNIVCRGENGAFLHGWQTRPLEDITFDEVRLEVGRSTEVPGGFYDLRPAGVFKGVFETRLAGIYARFVRGLALRQTQVVWGRLSPGMYGEALDKQQVDGLDLDHFTGLPASRAPADSRPPPPRGM